jgi:hypothetical protein
MHLRREGSRAVSYAIKQGVVDVQQMTMIDLSGERRVRVVEKLDGPFVDEVQAR